MFDRVAFICAMSIGHVSLAQMDATRQVPVVDRHNKRYLDQKGVNLLRTEGRGVKVSRAVGGAKGQDGSHGAFKWSFMKFWLFLPTSICKVTTN